MGFLAAVGSAYTNILNFSGRASRAEFWWFQLYVFMVNFAICLAMFGFMFSKPELLFQLETNPAILEESLPWAGTYFVANIIFLVIPGISIVVRRLHDIDRSGWWYFIPILPIIGIIILFVFLVIPGTPGRNRFGHDPYGRKGAKPTVRLPRGMKPAPSEAERRAEILEYYKKNVMNQNRPEPNV